MWFTSARRFRAASRKLANSHGCTVITPLDTVHGRPAHQPVMPVRAFMRREASSNFCPATTRIRSRTACRTRVSAIFRWSITCMISGPAVRKRAVILVDTTKQAVQAVEIIEDAGDRDDKITASVARDDGAAVFRNEPVGCTATIIYQIYREKGIRDPPQIAACCAARSSPTRSCSARRPAR